MTDTIRIEPLGDGRRILVRDGCTFGTDAFLLAAFARPAKTDNAVDLGTGCGIIPSIWLGNDAVRTVLGVELSADACELARRTAEINGDSARFSVLNLDLRALESGDIERERFDLVVCNPPYFVPGSGYIAPDADRARARTELDCSIGDVCAAAKYLLRYGGRLCVCHRPERLPDVICAMRDCGLEPKRMRMVHQRADKAPWLVLLEGRRGGKPSLEIMPPLCMCGADGSSSDEIEEMYGCYREGRRCR